MRPFNYSPITNILTTFIYFLSDHPSYQNVLLLCYSYFDSTLLSKAPITIIITNHDPFLSNDSIFIVIQILIAPLVSIRQFPFLTNSVPAKYRKIFYLMIKKRSFDSSTKASNNINTCILQIQKTIFKAKMRNMILTAAATGQDLRINWQARS